MRFKNLFSLSFLIIMLPLFLTGCKTEVMKSPEKLLEKPISDEFNHKIYTEIRKLTPIDTSFILPKNSNDIGKINVVNLNNDKSTQVIAFKKKVNEEQGLGSIYMYLFENKGSNLVDESERMVRFSGESIKSVNFVDLKGNGRKQIVLHISNRGFENIYVYEYINHNLKRIADYSTSSYNIKLNFSFYDNSHIKKCLALVQDNKNYDVFISRMILKGNRIEFERDQVLYNMDGLDKLEFVNGRVSKVYNGTMIVYQSFPGNIITEVIVMKDNKFTTVINDDNMKLKNIIFLRPVDINNNGILDIPKLEFRFTNNTPKESSVISWYEWNGHINTKDSKTNNLDLVKQIYYCYDNNFFINIPKFIQNKFYIQQHFDSNKSSFTFYENTVDGDKRAIFKILVSQRTAEDVEAKTKSSNLENVIMEDEGYRYIYEPINNDLIEEYELGVKDVKKLFSLINK